MKSGVLARLQEPDMKMGTNYQPYLASPAFFPQKQDNLISLAIE
jgi:hypothetical protein